MGQSHVTSESRSWDLNLQTSKEPRLLSTLAWAAGPEYPPPRPGLLQWASEGLSRGLGCVEHPGGGC